MITIVLRNFCKDDGALAWVNEIIATDVRIKRSVRVSRLIVVIETTSRIDVRCRRRIPAR